MEEFVKKQPEYPRTYEACCKVLGCKPIVGFAGLDDDEENLYGKFIALKRCRDAYHKIAGDEMGLRKPWGRGDLEDDDFENDYCYCIQNYYGRIIETNTTPVFNKILIFPTKEMRNIFFENFKELIEACKEFL